MNIHCNFIGGNIKVARQTETDVYLENELRDTTEDWFYWAFCVENAQKKTITFHFQDNRLGYFGPAISYDLNKWYWLNDKGSNEFTYTFGEDESKVYFAHSMLYHPERFLDFAKSKGLVVSEFCKSNKGRSVPCALKGDGVKSIILTARHHACESTGNYVLEGVLRELIKNPIANTKILCVPFMDYDGVIDGDQGKSRIPWDHNRDYDKNKESIYSETKKMKEYVVENGCNYGFDFHSPWHLGKENDMTFIVQNSFEKLDRLNAFGELFEKEITSNSFRYRHANDYPFKTGWNKGSTQFANYVKTREENEIAFTLETAYFGSQDNVITQETMIELGKCFARALKKYIEDKEGKIPLNNLSDEENR